MTTDFERKLDKYAEVAIKIGVNLKDGQRLHLGYVRSLMYGVPVQLAPLVRLLTKHAYQAGARFVNVLWEDQHLDLIRLQHGSEASLKEYPEWRIKSILDYMENGDAMLGVYAQSPDMLSQVDPQRIGQAMATASEHSGPVLANIAKNVCNWSVISGATPEWAAKIFPDDPIEQAVEKLWDAMFAACRIDSDDPVAAWESHVKNLRARSSYLNEKRYASLHYTGPGTDLTVGLVDDHLWLSAGLEAKNGIQTIANLPTEEVFTLPHKDRINGKVTATKPLAYVGQVVENFSLEFKDGRIVNATAETGQSALDSIINTDDGGKSLGEVALVPHSSPISQTNMLFYNILYDENASCHLAIGNGYKFCVAGGTEMDTEQFAAIGGNTSATHVDFMMGSGELNIDGITSDGQTEPIMRNGEWAFDV